MDRLKGVAKGGWHPSGKDGKKESWRGDYKGVNTVAGWMGKGKDASREDAHDHVARPLTSLKDPDSFGPPPKHTAYHGAAASPSTSSVDPRGWGAPLPEPTYQQDEQETAEEEANKPPPPPIPSRIDTTGLRTDNLPKPPVRRPNNTPISAAPSSPAKHQPGLPPRLPPRQNSRPDLHAPPPPPTYGEATQPGTPVGQINTGSASRLAQAGVSVPGFGIGQTTTPPASPAKQPQLSELQQRFSHMKTRSTPPPPESPLRSQGTTSQQKQDALETASSFRNDPSSLSLSDARNAASTANNFRERHGEQVASGARTASKLNQKYGIASRLGGIDTQAPAAEASPPPTPKSPGFKKPPPPPPKKKELHSNSSIADAPPPLPLNSKPRLG